jgi:hypothetical protein
MGNIEAGFDNTPAKPQQSPVPREAQLPVSRGKDLSLIKSVCGGLEFVVA